MAPSTSEYPVLQHWALPDRDSQLLNEIMPMIYKRFTEKSAEEWRQIYKVLCPSQLLDRP